MHDRSKENQYGDPSLEPIAFLSELVATASAANVSIVFYSGNDNVQHHGTGTEFVIQNMTFGGTQGLYAPGCDTLVRQQQAVCGDPHRERGLTYVLINDSGHVVLLWKPAQAPLFLGEFVT